MHTTQQFVNLALQVGGALATLAVFVTIFRWLQRRWNRIEEFLDDWNGAPPRPGIPQRLGVMERLFALEQKLDEHTCPVLRQHLGQTDPDAQN